MNSYEYIIAKQVAWAKSEGMSLIGSQGERGRPTYARELEGNLFRPLLPDVHEYFAAGDGGELSSGADRPAKMQALHSSSALGVNVFQYWKQIGDAPTVAASCGLCRAGSNAAQDLVFEEKYPIMDTFETPPNIDVVIHNGEGSKIKRLAIECKFSEAYGGRGHSGLKERYLDECAPLWEDIPHLRELGRRISPDDTLFQHLHPAQLIKHILGLKRAFGTHGFRLLYLWYDVLGPDGNRHRDEVEKFAAAATEDGVMFHSVTFQELILGMAEKLGDTHPEYVRYLTNRYV